MVVFLITNIWPTWRHVQTSGKNLGVFVCVCLCVCGGGGRWGGGDRRRGEGECGGGVSAIHARENKVNGLFSYCLHTIVI